MARVAAEELHNRNPSAAVSLSAALRVYVIGRSRSDNGKFIEFTLGEGRGGKIWTQTTGNLWLPRGG